MNKVKKFLNKIHKGAITYKSMLGKQYLIVYGFSFIEVQFTKKNFLHLTGVATTLNAQDFYQMAYRDKIKQKQIYFNARYPEFFANAKINNLSNIPKIMKSKIEILELIQTKTRAYKVGIASQNTTICLEEVINKPNLYIACSHRINHITNTKSKSNKTYSVDFILEKPTTAQKYDKITYQDQTKQLPQTIHHLIADNLKQQTQNTQIN